MGVVTICELGWLVVTVVPALGLLRDSRFRRRAPGWWVLLAGLLMVGGVGAGFLAFHWPGGLHFVTGGATLVLVGAWWRARPGYGRSRRLPPGSLSMARSVKAIIDPDYYRNEQVMHGPVFKMAQFHRGTVCIVGLERGHRLLREHERQLASGSLAFSRDLPGGFLRYMTPRTHRTYGGVFRAALARPVLLASEEDTVAQVRANLASLAGSRGKAGSVTPGRVLERVIFQAMIRIFFDLTPESPSYADLRSGFEVLERQSLSRRLTAPSRQARERLRAVVAGQVESLRDRRREGTEPGCVLEALMAADPELPDLTAIDNLIFIVRISSTNVVGLLHWILVRLGREPRWMDEVRREVESGARPGGTGGVADRVMMETLRLHQSEYLYRSVRESFDFDGFHFPSGWLVRVCVNESHRSDQVFERPEHFDPDRFLGRELSRSEYSPFGNDRHACNGVPLTRMLCRIVVQELCCGFDWGIVDDGAPERDFRHWSHWRPASTLALTLSPRPPEPRRRRDAPLTVPAKSEPGP